MMKKPQLFKIIALIILLGSLTWSCTDNAKRIKNVELVEATPTSSGDIARAANVE